MRFNEFLVNYGHGLEHRLGVLGETHIYTKEESEVSQQIITRYDTLLAESIGTKTPLWAYPLAFLCIPTVLKYMVAGDRSPAYTTAVKAATAAGKRIVGAPDCENLPAKQIGFLFADQALYWLVFPYDVYHLARYGDAHIPGTPAYHHRREKERTGQKNRLEQIADRLFPLGERDRIIAESAVDLINTERRNILVVCGDLHFDGVVNNLYRLLPMADNTPNLPPSLQPGNGLLEPPL